MKAGLRASLAVLVAIAVACDCGDDESDATSGAGAATGPSATGPAATGRVAVGASQRPDAGAPAAEPGSASAPPSGPIRAEAFPAGTDERAFLAAAGALPAWTAVRERARLLGRHGNRGAAWGRLRRDAGGQLWLIDAVESAAVLGIRLAGAGGRELHADAGGRVVAWGAWNADAERRWVWHVERLVALPAGKAAQPVQADAPPAPPLPGHLVAALPQRPEGALPPSQLQKPGQVLFVVLAAPAKPGDGWIIADQAKGPPGAFLVLPGEAAIYGGLDYLSPEERWPLAPGTWYAVSAAGPGKPSRPRKPVAPGKPPGPGDLPVLRASEPPARVPPPPAAAKKPKKTGATVRDR